MKSTTIARNYAEALFLAGEAAGDAAVERYGRLLDAVSGAIQADERSNHAISRSRIGV